MLKQNYHYSLCLILFLNFLFILLIFVPNSTLAKESASGIYGTNRFYGTQSLKPLINQGTAVIELPDEIMVETKLNQKTYLVGDHLNSVRVNFSANDNSLHHYEYTPYGDIVKTGDLTEITYRYTGHPYDNRQAVYETPNRNYDPTVTRFSGVDKKRIDPSPYLYASNNPIVFLDPTGNGKIPFYIKTGIKTHGKIYRKFYYIYKKLSGTDEAKFFDSDEIFSTSIEPESTRESLNIELSLLINIVEGKNKQTTFNNELYWFIGDDRNMLGTDNIEGTIGTLRGIQKNLVENIVIFDFSKKDTANLDGATAKLKSMGLPFEVVSINKSDVGHTEYQFEGKYYTKIGPLIDHIRNSFNPTETITPDQVPKTKQIGQGLPNQLGKIKLSLKPPRPKPYPDPIPSTRSHRIENSGPHPSSLHATFSQTGQFSDDIPISFPNIKFDPELQPVNPLFTERDFILLQSFKFN